MIAETAQMRESARRVECEVEGAGRSRLGRMALFVVTASAIGMACAKPPLPEPPVVVDADVRGCTPDLFENLGMLDVAVVIDTSQSTLQPANADIDGDGTTGTFEHSHYTDRDDSRLAAEVAALRELFQTTSGHDIRYSIVTYSGPSIARLGRRTERVVSPREGKIRVELTRDTKVLNEVLDEIEARGSAGATIFFAGMHHANRVLMRYRDPARRRIVLFMSDASKPFLQHPYGPDMSGNPRRSTAFTSSLDPRMAKAARKAISESIVFHTFGLSSDAESWRSDTLGSIARATGGGYHAVEDPKQFYCHLARAMLPPATAQIGGSTQVAKTHERP